MVYRFINRLLFTKTTVKNYKLNISNHFTILNSHNLPFVEEFGSAIKCFSRAATFHRQNAEKRRKNFILHSINDYIKLPLKGVHLDDNRRYLFLNFGEVYDLEYPVVWLRDNCQCPQCFDIVSRSRIHSSLLFTDDVIPKSVKSTEELVSIIWADGHRSTFRKDWLCKHSFQEEHQIERLGKDYVHQITWSAEDFQKILPNICFKFNDIIEDNNCLLKWLETLSSVGIAKILGAPQETGQLVKLSHRVSFIRKTHYGEEYFIKGDKNANNVAYQKGPLPMHTDLPYYQYVPGVVLLHFVTQSSKGGENILADGFNAVKQLSNRTYNILATTLVDWLDIGFEKDNKFHSMHRAPVICESHDGNIERINWSQPQRNSAFNVTVEHALDWYKAFEEFSQVIHDSRNAVHLKNEEGNILTFDNRRILHGRTDFAGERFLCGAYMDWDEIYSKIRVLKQDLKL